MIRFPSSDDEVNFFKKNVYVMGKYRLEEEEKESCLEGCYTFDPKIRLPINFFGCHLNLTADIKSFYLQKIIGTIYYETRLHLFYT